MIRKITKTHKFNSIWVIETLSLFLSFSCMSLIYVHSKIPRQINAKTTNPLKSHVQLNFSKMNIAGSSNTQETSTQDRITLVVDGTRFLIEPSNLI